MPDNNTPYGSAIGANCFKEAVCINANRIYDSCSDKDCVTDLRVYFSDCVQPVIDNATSVKVKEVKAIDVYMDVEPVPFNRGFYSVDITFYFGVRLDVFTLPTTCPTTVDGITFYSKKVILYGSEGNVSVFNSNRKCKSLPDLTYSKNTSPTATVQVVDPIALAAKLKDRPHKQSCVDIPECILEQFEGTFNEICSRKIVEVTLGVFFIASLERKVQMMIPVYDFSIPDKECTQTNDDPCELFRQIKFPVDEFFPPRLNDYEECETE